MGSQSQAPMVLIVEEEPLLRLAAIDMVEEAGFVALEARDSAQAIAVLESGREIAIVFADLDLTGDMDGRKLAAAIRDRWPPVKLVLTASSGTPATEDLPSGSRFFAKPYSDRQVTDAMRALAA